MRPETNHEPPSEAARSFADPGRTGGCIDAVAFGISAGVIRASYVNAHSRSSANGENDTGKLFALGYVHNMSKRTSLYTTLSQVNNSSTGRFLIPGGSAITPGQDLSGVEAGIYHSF